MMNLFKVLLSSVLPKIFMFVLNIILARSLSVNDFGLYAYAKSFYNFFENVVTSPLVPHSVSSLLNKSLRVKQVTALYLIIGILSTLTSIIVIIFDGAINNYLIPLIISIGVAGSIANSYLYVRIVSKDKINILLISSLSTILVLSVFLFFIDIESTVLAAFFAISFNVLDFLFKYILITIYNLRVNIEFDFNNLKIHKPIYLMFGVAISGVLFLIQRMVLVRESDGLEQMAYLEVMMQMFSLIVVFLTSQSNYLMGKEKVSIFRTDYNSMKIMMIMTLISSIGYGVLLIYGNSFITFVFNLEISDELFEALSVMVITFSFAFYSVRVVIGKNKQSIILYSNLLSFIFAFIPYLFMNVSALSVIYSYCVFYFFLFVFNCLFIYGDILEIKENDI